MFSSARRGQVEPLPALLALAVFGLSLSVYGTTLHGVTTDPQPTVDDSTVRQVVETVSEGTVVHPGRLSAVETSTPGGDHVSVVVRADGRAWETGPTPPDSASTTTRSVLVQTESGEVPGRLRVSTWP